VDTGRVRGMAARCELPRPVVLSRADGGGDSNGEPEVSSPSVLSISFLSLSFVHSPRVRVNHPIRKWMSFLFFSLPRLDLYPRDLAPVPMLEVKGPLGTDLVG
jgi:hypothetical protein